MQFQSTFPHGERLYLPPDYNNDIVVSIHVPARGTTRCYQHQGGTLTPFQSTFPHGERHPYKSNIDLFEEFQSTFPHGERHCIRGADNAGITGFNPRSRTGNDAYRRSTLIRSEVSIHVPARGTTAMSNLAKAKERFQSTFPHGERQGPAPTM